MGRSAKWTNPESPPPFEDDRPSAIRPTSSAPRIETLEELETPLTTAQIPFKLVAELARLATESDRPPPPPATHAGIKADAQRVLTIRTPAVEITQADLVAARRSVPDLEEAIAASTNPVLLSGTVAKADVFADRDREDEIVPISAVVLVGHTPSLNAVAVAVVDKSTADKPRLAFAPPSEGVMWIIFLAGMVAMGVAYWIVNG